MQPPPYTGMLVVAFLLVEFEAKKAIEYYQRPQLA
jgi:hypothetical protein